MSILSVYSLLWVLLRFWEGPRVIFFESLESKTADLDPVYNKVEFIEKKDLHIWKMRQSHYGAKAKDELWDEVQIRVDLTQRPFKASYHQIRQGKEVEYRAHCLSCHSSGPRFIRPKTKLGLKKSLTVFKWNVLIKSYGNVKVKKNEPFERRVGLIKNRELHQKKIKLKSCIQCHSNKGLRGELSQENLSTMKFLIDNKIMPPWPHKMSKEDRKAFLKMYYDF